MLKTCSDNTGIVPDSSNYFAPFVLVDYSVLVDAAPIACVHLFLVVCFSATDLVCVHACGRVYVRVLRLISVVYLCKA